MAELAELARKTELLPPIGASSKVWEYFGFPAKDGMLLFADFVTSCSQNKF